jgi:hypothetical protein
MNTTRMRKDGMKMRKAVRGRRVMVRSHLLHVMVLLSVVMTGCGTQAATPTDVINTWATAAAAGDWSRARELMTVGERIFTEWRERQLAINPDLNPPHQVLKPIEAGETTSATVRWLAKTGGWCAAVYVDADAKVNFVRPEPLYACDAQGQAITAPAEGETAPRTVVTAADVFAHAIEIDPIGKVQPGESVVVVRKDYSRNRYWYKVRPAPGSATTWTEGYIFASAFGDTR